MTDRTYTRYQAIWIYLVWAYGAADLFRALARAEGSGRSHWYDAMDDALNTPLFLLFKKVVP